LCTNTVSPTERVENIVIYMGLKTNSYLTKTVKHFSVASVWL